MIVLLKLGIDYATILTMSEGEVHGIIRAYNDLAEPVKPGKTYKVKR